MWFIRKDKKRPLFRRIINYFIYLGVGIIVLLLIAFGFTQTSSFRSWLKDVIVEQVNSSTNGVLSIGRIDGTILSSIILNNTLYKLDNDTVFIAEKIEVKTSPLKLIFKIFYFRKIEIADAQISFLRDENGQLNISRIIKPSEEPEDTTASEFNWKLQVADLSFKNVGFKLQNFDRKFSFAEYNHPDMNDLRLDSLNIELSAFADIANHEFSLHLEELNVKPNLAGFRIKNLSGNFIYFDEQAVAKDLNIVTERSDISLSAVISNLPVFTEENFDISRAPLRADLAATDFNFDDLTIFIEGTSLLKGNVSTFLNASGNLSDLYIEKLKAEFGETEFELTGRLQNILEGTGMNINAEFSNCIVNQDDITNLLPEIGIPLYKDYGVLSFDSLYFKGKPLIFNAGVKMNTKLGGLNCNLYLDLSKDEIIYDGRIETFSLNLQPFTGFTTNLNSSGKLSGKGFSPSTLTSDINFRVAKSLIGEEFFDEIEIESNSASGIIDSRITFISRQTSGLIDSKLNFVNEDSPAYSFNASINGFDLKDFNTESDFSTNLNLKLYGDGENFDPDHLNLFSVIQIDSSDLNGVLLDSTRIIVDVRSSENERVINIVSDLADLTISGSFNIQDLAEASRLETDLMIAAIERKIEAIQLPGPLRVIENLKDKSSSDYQFNKLLSAHNFDVNYLIEFKDFQLLSLLLGGAEIDIDGELYGKFFLRQDSISLNLESDISQLKFWDGSDLFYLSGFNLFADIDDKISGTSFEDFYSKIRLSAKRVFIGSEFRNLEFDLNMAGEYADFGFSTSLNDYLFADAKGSIDLSESEVRIIFNKLLVNYNKFGLSNNGSIDFTYSNNEFNFNSFSLMHGSGTVNLSGNFSFKNNINLSLTIANMNGKELLASLFGIPVNRTPSADINLNLSYTGTANNPEIFVDFTLDSILNRNVSLGYIKSTLNYDDKYLNAKINFHEFNQKLPTPPLILDCRLPVDLSLNSEDRLPAEKELELNFLADNFDLSFAGDLLPGISKLNGILEGNIKLTGNYNDISSDGNLKLKYGSFLLDANNLSYLLETGFLLKDDELSILDFTLSNSKETKGGGIITASGKIKLDNFDPAEINIIASGDLKLLSTGTKAVNPNLYGDVSIKTGKDIVYIMNDNQNYLSAGLILKKGSNVTFSTTQTAFTNETDKFIYKFVSSGAAESGEKEIDSLILISGTTTSSQDSTTATPVDMDINIRVEDEAKMVFVLSREFKQNLTAYLGGEFDYSVINNVSKARGELKLLEGSKLEFIKTFQAEGSVKFLDEIDNPYLNVVSTYQGYYNPDTLSTGTNQYEVQIKIKLEGPVRNLNTNFIKDERNVEVYKRRTSFGQFELDGTKTASDAMFFIIVGKFPEDASLQETNVAVSTAMSVAGTIVGGYLNEQLGDFVRSVNVQQVGSETKFSLIGKVGDIRYEIGGTSQVFQDLSRANIKIEYPFIFTRLILRLERREPSFQSSTYNEMINELGLKYSFNF